MKTITKTINLYTLEELSKEAQEKAHEKWNNDIMEYPFLEEDMENYLIEILLPEAGMKPFEKINKKGRTVADIEIQYSLGYCQGDGAMFSGSLAWEHKGVKYEVYIKHEGRYSHFNSKTFTIYKDYGNDETEDDEKINEAFDSEYVEVCRKLAKYGYKHIEHEQSFDTFKEICEANEYTFEIDGTMNNDTE